jgi:hypothetical protein
MSLCATANPPGDRVGHDMGCGADSPLIKGGQGVVFLVVFFDFFPALGSPIKKFGDDTTPEVSQTVIPAFF